MMPFTVSPTLQAEVSETANKVKANFRRKVTLLLRVFSAVKMRKMSFLILVAR